MQSTTHPCHRHKVLRISSIRCCHRSDSLPVRLSFHTRTMKRVSFAKNPHGAEGNQFQGHQTKIVQNRVSPMLLPGIGGGVSCPPLQDILFATGRSTRTSTPPIDITGTQFIPATSRKQQVHRRRSRVLESISLSKRHNSLSGSKYRLNQRFFTSQSQISPQSPGTTNPSML